MSYITIDTLKNYISERDIALLSNDADATTIDADVVQRVIDDAEDHIDSYLAKQYLTPLGAVPDIITRIAADIVIYDLYSRRGDQETPQTVSDRKKNAEKWLIMVSRGEVKIGITESSTTDPGGIKTNKAKSDRIFNNLEDF